MSLGIEGNSTLAKAAIQISNTLLNYRHTITGAAFSEEEEKAYLDLIPQITDSFDLANDKISAMQNSFHVSNNSFYKQAIGSLYTKLSDQIANPQNYSNTGGQDNSNSGGDYYPNQPPVGTKFDKSASDQMAGVSKEQEAAMSPQQKAELKKLGLL